MPAAGLRWRSAAAVTRGMCSPRPWAHVLLGQRAALRTAYAAVLADRLALSAAPATIPCPSRGCALCGVDALTRSAIEVRRWGHLKRTVLSRLL